MKTWDVEIEWVAVATVRVEAETQEEAQVLASKRGLPWQEAGEGCDGSQTHYTATCVEEDEDFAGDCTDCAPGCPGDSAHRDGFCPRAKAEDDLCTICGGKLVGESAVVNGLCDRHEVEEPELPLCVLAMGCYCAGHARGNPVDAECDTSEEG